jgi:hypothetical protein
MHRDGFSALQPAGLREEKDFLVATADRVASKRDGGPFDVSVMAIPFKGPTETGVVRTVVEIEGPGLLVDDERTLMTLDIETYLIDEEVGAVALSTRRLALDLTNQADLIRGGGVKVLEEHLLGTGDHRLRIVLRDREKGRLSIASALVRVPDFETGEPQLFEPVFPELSRHWLVVRDGEGTQGDVSENPFQFGGKRFLPRVEVRLASGASVPVCVMAFDLPAEMSAVEVALLDSDGETAEGLSVGWASEPERGDDGLVRRLAKLDTSTVTPGRYQIRVSYGGDSEGSNKVASRWIEIR